jgi:polyisoprenoid-binding protein YceI
MTLTSPASAAPTYARLAGSWKITTGSEAGYRAREQFINQPEPTEAVARTSHVTGGLVVGDTSSSFAVHGIHVRVDLSTLQSQDTYATYQAYQRDFFVRTIYLQSDRMPYADFKGDALTLPARDAPGPVAVKIGGTLTLHGVSKHVIAQAQLQMNGAELEVVGSLKVDMRDFAIDPPTIGFTRAEPGVTIEFHLLLAR